MVDTRFWRCKWPITADRLRRIKTVLEATGESEFVDAVALLDDDQLVELLHAIMGVRSKRAIKRRLSLGGALTVIFDFGVHASEVKKVYEGIRYDRN